MSKRYYHAVIWIDHHEARAFHFNPTDVERLNLHPDHPTTFPDNKIDRQIAVGFDVAGTNWKLSVTDNGIGAPVGVFAQAKSGLGTSIINALAQQLEARVEVLSGPQGTTASVIHATFAKMPQAVSTAGGLRHLSTHGHA